MAPSILLTIPTEMLPGIFSQVPDPDSLIHLAVICRQMHTIAEENFLPRHRTAATELRDLDLRPGAVGANVGVLAGCLEHFLLNRREGWYVKRLRIGGLRTQWDEEEEEEEGRTTVAGATTAATATTATATAAQPSATAPATRSPPHTPYPDDTMAVFLHAHDSHTARLLYDKQMTREQMGAFFEAKLRKGDEDVVAALLLCVLPGLERVRFEIGRDGNGGWQPVFWVRRAVEGMKREKWEGVV